MRISVFVSTLLIVGLVMFMVIQMVNESEEHYDVAINKTEWENQYDYAQQINNSISPIKNSIDTITNQDSGWLDKVGAGFTGIIKAVTFLPGLVATSIGMASGMITGIGTWLGLPSYFIFVGIVLLIAWGVFELIEFFQRWRV